MTREEAKKNSVEVRRSGNLLLRMADALEQYAAGEEVQIRYNGAGKKDWASIEEKNLNSTVAESLLKLRDIQYRIKPGPAARRAKKKAVSQLNKEATWSIT